MLTANIEIDNHTAYGESWVDGIKKRLLKDAEFLNYDKKTKTATYWTPFATVKFKNMRDI